MAILKNVSEIRTDSNVLFERSEYLTDPAKTRSEYIGALGCSPRLFPRLSRALKKISHKEDNKMLRHFVVSISPCDEGKDKHLLMKAGREIAQFFKDCYALYSIHTNTEHTHIHIIICNTRISDGKQISVSDSDLERFKEHCSSVLRKYGFKPIEKIDSSAEGDPLEINELLYYPQMTQEERVNILYEGVSTDMSYGNSGYRRPIQTSYVNNTVNVIIPPGTQGTLFQGRDGNPCISFKPSFDYLRYVYYLNNYYGYAPQYGYAPLLSNADIAPQGSQYYATSNTFNGQTGVDEELRDDGDQYDDPYYDEPYYDDDQCADDNQSPEPSAPPEQLQNTPKSATNGNDDVKADSPYNDNKPICPFRINPFIFKD